MNDNPTLINGEDFPIVVRFTSDWHMGTGTGRHGAIDRKVRRDVEGFPMVGAKTAVGVLRDAAETIAAGLDEGTSGLWHSWVDTVFGTHNSHAKKPQAAALTARPLRLPESIRSKIMSSEPRSRELLINALVITRPGVTIDGKTGVAKEDYFRIEERARAGLSVTAHWRLTFDGVEKGQPIPWEAEFLLHAAAKLVDSLGGKRRRGAGCCEIVIRLANGNEYHPLKKFLGRLDTATAPPKPPTHQLGAVAIPSHTADDLVHRYDLRITALTPIIVARSILGNLVHTTPVVPGTSLLPLVAEALGSDATAAITGGRVLVTNATLEIEGQRSRPIPRTLQREKGENNGKQLFNRFHEDCPNDKRLRPQPGFCVPFGDGIALAQPTLVEYAHAVIEDERQRPDESTGGLYVYETIAAGSILRAEVWATQSTFIDLDKLEGSQAIGRSRKDDYGQVTIEVKVPEVSEVSEMSGPAAVSTGDELVVWLTSDMLLRGRAGEPVADVESLRTALVQALGVELKLPPLGDTRPSAMVSTTRIESWQRRWSLPRPSLTGLAAGSVVRFTMEGTPTREAVRRVHTRGLGERTVEGFGRLVLQPAILSTPLVNVSEETDRPLAEQPEVSLTDAEKRILHSLQLVAWREELRQRAVSMSLDDAQRQRLVPPQATAAQIGRLRTLADQLARDGNTADFQSWLESAKSHPERSGTWGKERLEFLTHVITQDDTLWEFMKIKPPKDVSHHHDQLRRETVAVLLSESARMAILSGSTATETKERP